MMIWKYKGGEAATWLGEMMGVANQARKENIY